MTDQTPPGANSQLRIDEPRVGMGGRTRAPVARRVASPSQQGGALGRIFMSLSLVFVALIAAIGTFLIAVPPSALVTEKLVAAVKDETGRDLKIAGGASVGLFPLAVVLRDVSLSPPPGMESGPVLTAAEFDARVDPMALLSGEINIPLAVLRNAVIDLRIDRDGRRSWDQASVAPVIRLAQAGGQSSASDGARPASEKRRGRPAAGSKLPRSLALENATLRYADERSDVRHEIRSINSVFDSGASDQPVSLKGTAAWFEETVAFNGTLTSPALLMDKQPATLALNISGQAAETVFDGTVSFADTPRAEGALRLRAPSAGRLAASLRGEAQAPVDGAPVAIDGQIDATPREASIDQLSIEIGGTAATGSISVEKTDKRPFWRADLKVADLNLNTLNEALEPRTEAASDAQPAKSIEDLIDRGAPKVKGYTKRAGWSDEALDLRLIKAVDGEFKFAVGRLQHKEIKAGPLQIGTLVTEGRLTTTLNDAELYNGRARGEVSVDASGETPIMTANVSADGLDGRSFLRDAAALDWLAGTTKFAVAITGQGASEQALVESIDGTASVGVRDGALVGINIPKAIRNLGDGELSIPAPSPDQATDFADMTASFVIKDGVAESKDLQLTSPLLRVTGQGRVRLPAREIDYVVKPKLVASLEGQGGERKLAGVEIPVRIKGSWEQPSFSPDLGSIMKDPSGAVEVVKEIGKKLKGKGVSDVLRGLFGNDKKADGEEPQDKRKLLDQFLRQ